VPKSPDRFLTLPNLVSLSRVVLVPYVLYLFYQQRPQTDRVAFALALVALLTDYLDGYLARRLGQVSKWGKILDPVADKICVAAAAVVAVDLRDYPLWVMILIILRDVAILSGGLYIVKRRGLVMVSDLWGKITVVVLSASILVYLVNLEVGKLPLLYLAVAAIVVSSLQYSFRFRRAIIENPERF
jgi:CDP-diacylglycerol--glycerol-3-phosphate 3-phosphatidyltransferase